VDPRPPPLTLSDLECVKALGEGVYGQVLLVRTRRATHPLDRPGSLFAVKVMRRKNVRFAEKSGTKDKNIERSILAELPWNQFVAGIIQTFKDPESLYMMLELIPCGTLRSLIQKRAPLDPSANAFYFANIVAGLSFLEEQNLRHRDLKPENILVGADGYLVIADFGTVARLDEENDWIMIGSPAYMAPELSSFDKQTRPTYLGVDWWSAGAILYEMTYRKLPFHGKSEADAHIKAASGIIRWREHVNIGKHLKSLISSLLTVDAVNRLGTGGWEEVRNHEWLKLVKWSGIEERKYLAPFVPNEPHLADTWHSQPLPQQKKIPGLRIVTPPPHLAYNDCFPPKEDI
ncbi:kinase-like domain-containing protein, partial [Lyophyllum atratum]